MQKLIALALILAASTACYHVTYTTGKPIGGIKVKDDIAFYLGGLVGAGTIDVSTMCKNGAARVDVWQTFGDSILGIITGSIYVPRTYEVWCAADETASLMKPELADPALIPATPSVAAVLMHHPTR